MKTKKIDRFSSIEYHTRVLRRSISETTRVSTLYY